MTKALTRAEMTTLQEKWIDMAQTIDAEEASSCLLSAESHSDPQSEVSHVSSFSVQEKQTSENHCDTRPFLQMVNVW